MDRQMFMILGAVLLVVVPVGWHVINIIDRKIRIEKNIGASLSKKYQGKLHHRIYLYLRSVVITRNYIDRISRRYEILYPGNRYNISKNTVNSVFITWILCLSAIGIILMGHMNFNNTAVSILLVYVINTEVIGSMVNKTEIILLEDMALFVSNVRHNYFVNHMIDDALLLSMRDIGRYEHDHSLLGKLFKRDGYEMKVHAEKLYEIVTASNIKEEVMNYNATMHNKYMKMFLSLCINVIEYGDKTVKGQNLFTGNLDHLKRQIHTDIIKLKKIRYMFSGITFVTIAVCIPIDAVRSFALSIVPELVTIYDGRIGRIYVTLTILAAFGIYLLNNHLKETNRQLPQEHYILKKLEKIKLIKKILNNYSEKHVIKFILWKDMLKTIGESLSPRQFLLKRVALSAATCIISVIFFFYLHDINQKNVIEKVSVLPENITVVNSVQSNLIKETIEQYLHQYKNKNGDIQKALISDLTKEGTFYNTKINEAIAVEVVRRINIYRNEYFKWYELLLCFGIAATAYFVPVWMILYRKKVMQLNMEEEVNQLNSIIYMLMYSDHITVKDLLEEMELFAVVFRQTIHECINDYNSGDIEALERMKEKESFGPFIRLTDNLIRCDDIAIYKAFDEIATDRENYFERRILEDEITIQRRVNIAQPLAWIPPVLVMIYLILPIVSSSMEAFQTFKDMTTNI